MPTTIRNTDILFNDSSVQSTAAGVLTIKATSSYTSSGTSTWTKASGATGDTVVAVVIGGGGSGARSTVTSVQDKYGTVYSAYAVTGGGGGGVAIIAMPYEDCPSTVSVTVGAGGAARSTDGAGNDGSRSSFGNFAKATGGQGGYYTFAGSTAWSARLASGGLGGGALIGNSSNNADSPDAESTSSFPRQSGGHRNGGTGRAQAHATAGGFPLSYTSLITAGLTGGGGSLFFTAGASSTAYLTQNATGGQGRIFGDAGTAGTGVTNGGTGSNPGGGGGAHIGSASSGAGGTGAVYIYVVAGFVPASSIIDRAAGNKFTIAF